MGGTDGTLRGFAAMAEFPKKLGIPVELNGFAAGLLSVSTLLTSLTSPGAPRGGASARDRVGLEVEASVPKPTNSEFSLREVDVSALLVSGREAGLPKVKGREVIGGSVALVRSFCSGFDSGFAKENPAGISNAGSFLEASSSIACSFCLASSSPSIASSPSSS